jgi:hypothetical protein
MVAEHKDGTDILVPTNIDLGSRVFHFGHRIHVPLPFGFLGIIDDQIEGFPLLWVQGSEQLADLPPEGGFWTPACQEGKVVEASPVARGLQIPVQLPVFDAKKGVNHL